MLDEYFIKLFMKVWEKMTKKAILTIDDAPSADFSNKLNALKKRDIQAVWFCEGKKLEQYPELIIESIQNGVIIANHSYSHPAFSYLSLDACFNEIDKTHHLINTLYDKAGVDWKQRYFRFPYLDKGGRLERDDFFSGNDDIRHPALQNHLRELGYTGANFEQITYPYYREYGWFDDVDWSATYDTMDWSAFSEQPQYGIDSPEKVLARMDEDVPMEGRGLHYPQSLDIILMHDHEGGAIDLFPKMIDKLCAFGIEFIAPDQR